MEHDTCIPVHFHRTIHLIFIVMKCTSDWLTCITEVVCFINRNIVNDLKQKYNNKSLWAPPSTSTETRGVVVLVLAWDINRSPSSNTRWTGSPQVMIPLAMYFSNSSLLLPNAWNLKYRFLFFTLKTEYTLYQHFS